MAIALLSIAFVASKDTAFRAGVHNFDPPFFVTKYDIIAIGIWICCVLALIFVTMLQRRENLKSLGVMFCCLAAMPTAWIAGPNFGHRYDAGIDRWIVANINVNAFQGWSSSLPDVPEAVELPTNQWPPFVTTLKPFKVFELANRRGVLLQYGAEGSFTFARIVIITNDSLPFRADDLPEMKRDVYKPAMMHPNIFFAHCTMG